MRRSPFLKAFCVWLALGTFAVFTVFIVKVLRRGDEVDGPEGQDRLR